MPRKTALTMAAVALVGLAWPSTSQADDFGFSLNFGRSRGHHQYDHGYTRQYHRPYYGHGRIYHPPSVHYDRVYHADYHHWTPRRGWHSHGHYDVVPHYTPGHYDRRHGDHIDPNPWYHH